MKKGTPELLLETRQRATKNLAFSELLRQLAPDAGSAEPEVFLNLLDRLRGALVHEMKKRGLWEASPSYLGIYGDSRWEDDLLEDLVLSCYEFIFVRRLEGLVRNLEAGSNVDGLVFLDIRHFLHETQKRHDPLGYRVFDLLRAAVQQLVTRKTLFVIDGDSRLRNHTLLAFSSWCLPEEVPETDLEPIVQAWNEDLLPDLVTAWNREGVTQRLAERIVSLESEGIPGFRFGDVLGPLKADVRARWLAIATAGLETQSLDGLITDGRWLRPDLSFEERRRFDRLLRCTEDGLTEVGKGDRTREYLRRLLLFLQTWATEEDPETQRSSQASLEPWAQSGTIPEGLPSDTRLGEILGIPRARIPGLKAMIGELLHACRGELDRPTGSDPGQASSRRDDAQFRRESLFRATERALTELRMDTITRSTPALSGPNAGDLYLLRPDLYPGQWAIIDAEGDRVRVAPLDDFSPIGRHDTTLGGRASGRRVRAHRMRWLPRDTFTGARRAGRLEPEDLERIRQHSGSGSDPGAPIGDVDQTTAYRDWMARLDDACEILFPEEASQTSAPLRFPKSGATRPRWPVAIAASLATAVLGLSLFWVVQTEPLPQPRIYRTSTTQDLRFLDVKRGGGATELQPASEDTLVYLDLSRVPEYPRYLFELLQPEDRSVAWTQQVEADTELVLAIPRGSLPETRYLLRLSGIDEDGRNVELAEHSIQIDRGPRRLP